MGLGESSFSGNKFEELSGIALERELFGEINLKLYQELVEKELATRELKIQSPNLTLKDLKTRIPEKYNELMNAARVEYLRNLRNPVLEEKALFDIIKKCQLTNNPSLFIVDMKASLAQKFGVDVGDISFYSSINTNADCCGVDGIFNINYKGSVFEVSVDLTEKTEEAKVKEIQDKIDTGAAYWGNLIFSFDQRGNCYKRDRDEDLLAECTNKIVTHFEKTH